MRSEFMKKAGITEHSTGQELRTAVLTSTLDSPLPRRLLTLTYAHQFDITQLTGFSSKRDSKGERLNTWLTHWAPTTVLAAHAPACHALGLPISSDKPTSATHHLLTWDPLRLPEPTIIDIIGKDQFSALVELHKARPQLAQPPPRQDDHLLTCREQQGCWAKTEDYPTALLRDIRSKIILDPTECHPDWDITPPGRHLIQVGVQIAPNTPTLQPDQAFIFFFFFFLEKSRYNGSNKLRNSQDRGPKKPKTGDGGPKGTSKQRDRNPEPEQNKRTGSPVQNTTKPTGTNTRRDSRWRWHQNGATRGQKADTDAQHTRTARPPTHPHARAQPEASK